MCNGVVLSHRIVEVLDVASYGSGGWRTAFCQLALVCSHVADGKLSTVLTLVFRMRVDGAFGDHFRL